MAIDRKPNVVWIIMQNAVNYHPSAEPTKEGL